MTKIDEAHASKAQAKRRLYAAVAAVLRGRKAADDANAEQDRAERAADATRTAQAATLAAALTGEGPLSAVPDTDNEDQMLALVKAMHRASVTAEALAKLEANEAQARGDLKLAEAQVIAAANEECNAWRLTAARAFIAASTECKRLGEIYRAHCPDPLDTPINQRLASAPEFEAADALLPVPDALNTPINERLQVGPPELRAQLAAQRAALLAGPPEPSESEAA